MCRIKCSDHHFRGYDSYYFGYNAKTHELVDIGFEQGNYCSGSIFIGTGKTIEEVFKEAIEGIEKYLDKKISEPNCNEGFIKSKKLLKYIYNKNNEEREKILNQVSDLILKSSYEDYEKERGNSHIKNPIQIDEKYLELEREYLELGRELLDINFLPRGAANTYLEDIRHFFDLKKGY